MSSLTISVMPAASMPNLAVFFEPAKRWMIHTNLADLVSEFCAERDCGNGGMGYGSRDFQKRIVLYRMSANRLEKRAIGQIHYNGNVQASEALS